MATMDDAANHFSYASGNRLAFLLIPIYFKDYHRNFRETIWTLAITIGTLGIATGTLGITIATLGITIAALGITFVGHDSYPGVP